jgi:diadenosine tetraphosphate (Ap4A) HIT family hydrolase
MKSSPVATAAHPAQTACELCHQDGGLVLWRDADWRLVRVDDAAFPGFFRLIHNHHVTEFSQLSPPARQRCMALLAWVEAVVIQHLRPTKMNLAALGNVVPHVHWHVVARFDWDSHFPNPIWAAAQRSASPDGLLRIQSLLPAQDAALTAGPPEAEAAR